MLAGNGYTQGMLKISLFAIETNRLPDPAPAPVRPAKPMSPWGVRIYVTACILGAFIFLAWKDGYLVL